MVDYSGKKIGFWTAIEPSKTKGGRSGYLCECICGKKKVVDKYTLIHGKSNSCGCVNKNSKSYNNYYIVGDIVYVQYRKSYDCFICDLEDWEKLKDLCWYKDSGGYARSGNGISQERVSFHRIVMDCPDDMEVDHVNGKKWDNRKCNLRIVTRHQNNLNHKTPKNNTSGHIGVIKRGELYEARIVFNGKDIYLGRYKTFEEAVKVRKEAEEKYFGEYRRSA